MQRKEEKTSENEIRKKLKIERIFSLREKFIRRERERERKNREKTEKMIYREITTVQNVRDQEVRERERKRKKEKRLKALWQLPITV